MSLEAFELLLWAANKVFSCEHGECRTMLGFVTLCVYYLI